MNGNVGFDLGAPTTARRDWWAQRVLARLQHKVLLSSSTPRIRASENVIGNKGQGTPITYTPPFIWRRDLQQKKCIRALDTQLSRYPRHGEPSSHKGGSDDVMGFAGLDSTTRGRWSVSVELRVSRYSRSRIKRTSYFTTSLKISASHPRGHTIH